MITSLICFTLIIFACQHDSSELASLPAIDLSGSEKQVAAKIGTLIDGVKDDMASALAWGKLAMNLDAHDFKQYAIPCYERAIALDSIDFRWPYYYAILLNQLGDENAIHWFEQSRSRNPNYTPLSIRLGKALLEAGELERAAHFFEFATKQDSSGAHAYTGLARVSIQQGNFEKGRQQLFKAIEVDSLHRNAYGLLAELERRSGNTAASEAAFRKAQKLPASQSIPDSLYGLLTNEGVSALWYRTRGEKLLADGRIHGAAYQFKQALAINPSAPGYMFVGKIYEKLNDDSLAAQQFQNAVISNAQYVPAYISLGKALYRLGKYDSAIKWSEMGLSMKTGIPDFYDIVAKSCVATNRVAIAIDTYKHGLEQTRGNILLTTRFAWLLATGPTAPLRDGSKAIELARHACERTQYKSAGPVDALAAAYAEVGKFQQAVEIARNAYHLAKSSNQDE
ncbi:MAG: tetratricopeptide repeat protein, partial [bacterium]